MFWKWGGISFCGIGWPGTHKVVKTDFKTLATLLAQPPGCQNYRRELLYLILSFFPCVCACVCMCLHVSVCVHMPAGAQGGEKRAPLTWTHPLQNVIDIPLGVWLQLRGDFCQGCHRFVSVVTIPGYFAFDLSLHQKGARNTWTSSEDMWILKIVTSHFFEVTSEVILAGVGSYIPA